MDPRILAKRRMRKEKRRLDRVKLIQNVTLFVLFTFILYLIINSFIISIINVDGSSMSPTFHDGDRLIFSKINISSKSLKRGEVVVFEGKDKRRYVKRIVGLPGELVEIKEGKVFVNGEALKTAYEENYTHHYNVDKWYLKDGEFFVIGDNRSQNDSKDSRIFGPIYINDIDGKLLFEF